MAEMSRGEPAVIILRNFSNLISLEHKKRHPVELCDMVHRVAIEAIEKPPVAHRTLGGIGQNETTAISLNPPRPSHYLQVGPFDKNITSDPINRSPSENCPVI